MQKNYLFYLLFIVFMPTVFAQNWQPLMWKDTINFKHKDSLFTTQSVWVENIYIPNTGDTTFILNETLHHFIAPVGSYCGEGIAYHLPHFLQKQVIKQVDSTWLFQSPNITYLLKPFAALNDTWLFDANNNITANVVAIDTFSVVGQLDSIKVISLSTGDSIILSKNYGFMHFPTFDSTSYVSWAGIQNRNIGERVYNFREIFDFEIGDVLYYHTYNDYNSIMNSYQTNRKVKITITNKTIALHSVSYNFHFEIESKRASWGTLTLTISNFNRSLTYGDGSNYAYNTYPLGHSYIDINANPRVNYALIGWNTTWNCWEKSFPYPAYYSLGNIDTLWGGGCFENSGYCNIKYGKGISLIANNSSGGIYGPDITTFEYDSTLVGYIKNGVSYGTIYPDSIFTATENQINQHFIISPNPSENDVSLSYDYANYSFKVVDMYGKEIYDSKELVYGNRFTIEVQDYDKGMYFVKVFDEGGKCVYSEKFVKE